MLLRILSYIPFVNCLAYFSPRAHLQASKKLFVLWVLTSMPVLFAVLLSPIPDGDAAFTQKLANKLAIAFTASEQFVYAAAFIAPILYIIYEKVMSSEDLDLKERFTKGFGIFRGYWLVVLVSFLVLFLTAAAFSALKVNQASYELSFLSRLLVSYSALIYVFAIYCWYLTLLDATFSGDYVGASRRDEQSFGDRLAERLRNQGVKE